MQYRIHVFNQSGRLIRRLNRRWTYNEALAHLKRLKFTVEPKTHQLVNRHGETAEIVGLNGVPF